MMLSVRDKVPPTLASGLENASLFEIRLYEKSPKE